ncbi:MAG: NAD-binding protein [Isosphaera sp.]|nr:NAD-binding protein [Isosphaera sp.]
MTWDAVVVGAGPAGSVAARELARRGCRVLLVDKAAFPRSKVCGCCLNRAAVGTLARLGLGHVLRGAVPLDRVSVAAGRRRATLPLPGGVALSRTALDTRLAEAAVSAGVEFRPGVVAKWTPAESVGGLVGSEGGSPSPAGEAPATSPRRGEVWLKPPLRALPTRKADEGAGGPHLSPAGRGRRGAAGEGKGDSRSVTLGGEPVATRLLVQGSGLTNGDAEPGSRIGAGVVLPADAPVFYAPGTIHMATGRGGYVGLVRVEDGRLDVAAAFDVAFVRAEGGPGPAAETILREVGWPVPDGFAAAPWKGTPALTRRPTRLAGHRTFVVGDAAGYVEPFTGEGMAWAVTSAAALAPIAARAVDRWDDALAAEWEATHRRVVGRRQRVCRAVSRVLRSPTLTGVAIRALSLFPAAARPVVSALNQMSPLPRVARA